jgi:hypothetical protein
MRSNECRVADKTDRVPWPMTALVEAESGSSIESQLKRSVDSSSINLLVESSLS